MAKEFLENIRAFGCSFGYTMLVETDFAAPAGLPYVPPERGESRRNNEARTIQLLQDASGVIETFQLSAATVKLPSNQIGNDETGNDAGDGRWFFLRNSGAGILTIKNSVGAVLTTVFPGITVTIISNNNQQWDIYFKATSLGFNYDFLRGESVDAAIRELADNDSGKGYTEVSYTGVFVNEIKTYDSPAKAKLLDSTVFYYTGAFVTSIEKIYYNFGDGITPVVRQVMTLVYNPNKSLQSANIVMSRL